MTTEKNTVTVALEDNVVGPRIRTFRMAARLTQRELAARCRRRGLDLTRGMLAKIECRVRPLLAVELFIIAKALRIPMPRFFPPRYGNRESKP